MLSVLFGSALIGGALGAEWTIIDSTSATTLVGVGADSDVRAVAAAAQNGLGAVVERYDGENWPKERVEAGLLLDAAVSSDYTVATTVFPILVSKDNGATYTTSENLAGAVQDAQIVNGAIYLTGGFAVPVEGDRPASGNGVARSTDGGDSWTMFNVPAGYARYGAFPSENTWYVASGIWGDDPEAIESGRPGAHSLHDSSMQARVSLEPFALSARASMGGIATGGVRFNARQGGFKKPTHGNTTAADGLTGWTGTISKTTDAGATWSTVFQSDVTKDYYYFNQIACADTKKCVAVAEGDDAVNGGYLVAAYLTMDGGATWNNVLNADNTPDNVVSIMGATWVSETEAWLGATSKQGPQLSGVFFHTTDGGATFSVEQELPNCFLMDLDFANGVGYAACSSSSGASCSVAMYV